jgi:hypothetical protein
MTTSRLPEITVACRSAHPFQTRAHGGQAVDCPQCRAGGERVKVWIPKDRPRTARELADRAAVDGTAPAAAVRPDAELVARWESEPEWDGGQLPDWPGRPGDTCLECGGPLAWEPGRTWTDCDACAEGDGGMSLPAAVLRHYERRAELATRASAEVAIRPDVAAEQAARVRLRALRDGARQRVESWLDTIADPDSYDRGQNQGQARQLAAMLGAWLPEINTAADESALAATWKQIDALVTGEQGRALSAEHEQAQARIRQRYEAQQYAIEYEQQQRELAEQQEREQREAEREAREAEREQARQRKAITNGHRQVPVGNAGMLAVGINGVVKMVVENRERRESKIAEHGPCGYTDRHKKPEVSTRRYWIIALDWQGNDTGYAFPNAPQVVVCQKHYALADEWIGEQAESLKAQGNTQLRPAYTELT